MGNTKRLVTLEEFNAINAFDEPDELPQVLYKVEYSVARRDSKNLLVCRHFQVKNVAERFEDCVKDNKAKDISLTTVSDNG